MFNTELINIASKIALNQIGLDLRSIGNFMMETAISKRMRRCALDSDQYALKLESNINEQQALCQLLLVSESWFERESEPLNLAVKSISCSNTPIRVLSIPCARGEEPISILSLAIQSGIPISKIKIECYDASSIAIEQAKLFSFGEYSFRGTSEKFRNENFKKHGPRFLLNTNLRDAFQFHQANIVDPNWLPKYDKYDLIVCRNMLIYLDQAIQKQLLVKLQTLLDDKGLLILGAAEAALASYAELDRSEISTLIFRKKNKSTDSKLLNFNTNSSLENRQHNQSFLKTQKFDSVKITKSNLINPCDATKQSFEMANKGKLGQAFEKALESIEKNPEDSNNYYLLGLISSSTGKIEEARYWVSKALELNPQNEDAEIFLNSLVISKLRK